MSDVSIALNRFGLGARPDEPPPGEPRAWLVAQLDRFESSPAALSGLPSSADALRDLQAYRLARRDRRSGQGNPAKADPSDGQPPKDMAADDPLKQLRSEARRRYRQMVDVRFASALTTPTPFAERLAHFWANHFAISADKFTTVELGPTLEFEAIRPHLNGRFVDMLLAVERHPAMLLYLDQAQSVGPDSPIGRRRAAVGGKRIGLNENLAREILELHTLGVRTGYGQGDVTEFARALTGWTVAGRGGGIGDTALFRPGLHQPGARTVLGRIYDQLNAAQSEAIMRDLAAHPATARHVATKLARHFAGDQPPPAMVARLEQAFLRSDGDLPALHRAVVESPEAWAVGPVKYRTPWEWTVASFRAVGARQPPPAGVAPLLDQLGQPVWRPGQPSGYDDVAATWASADGLMRRVEAAERLAARAGAGVDARALAQRLYPGAVSAGTAQALARAESLNQMLALLLVAPEAMRR